MAANKYSRDYRLLEHFDERGRVRTDYEYIGDPWIFCHSGPGIEAEKKKILGLSAAAAAAFLAALFPFSGMMRTLWIALPFIFTIIPIVMTIDLAIAMQRFPDLMEHRHADKLNNAYPARTLAILYLSAVSLIAEAVYLILYGVRNTGDVLFPALTACIVLCGYLLFRKRNSVRAEVRKAES